MNMRKNIGLINIKIAILILLITGLILSVVYGSTLLKSGNKSTNNSGNESVAGSPSNWPLGIPAEILPLPGTISTANIYSTRIRLSYSDGVSRKVLEDYVKHMESNGFEAKFETYVTTEQEQTMTDKAISSMKYGGVLLTKGNYKIRIVLSLTGNDGATYTLDGLSADATKVGWPNNWVDRVPEPEGTFIDGSRGIFSATDDNLWVICTYKNVGVTEALVEEHKKTVQAYYDKLLNLGYKTTTDESHFTNGKWNVFVRSDEHNGLDMEVKASIL
jgi:hypothetical protein